MWRAEPFQIAAAFGLDLLLGDPRGWPHIARAAGTLACFYERLLTAKCKRSVALGILFWCMVTGTMLGGYCAAHWLCSRLHPLAGRVLEVLVIYQSIAAMDLARHVKHVLTPLLAGNLEEARDKLSWIVGRETRDLDAAEISRAAIEAVAESLTDAIVAPLFWAVIAGAPGALLYRAVNTLDSMAGHRDARYEKVGKASARIDDAMNWIPARLAGACVAALRGFARWKTICREALKHASPNAGWTEAAMAYLLGIRLGGENVYDGIRSSGPIFNAEGRQPQPRDVARSLRVMWAAVGLALGILLALSAVWNACFHF